jgi:hypothetical protein
MGYDIANWDAVEGALYMGAHSSWEVIWTVIAALVCIGAVYLGSRHELDAYKRMQEGKEVESGHG